MGSLNESGLSLLWQRIRMLVIRPLSGVLGRPDRIVTTDSGGRLCVQDAFRVSMRRRTVYETAAASPDDLFPLGVGDVHLLLVIADDGMEEILDRDFITLETDGQAEMLVRRHFGNDPSLDPCIVFGNTAYTGYGTPPCQDQADTGEGSMVFFTDGMLGICLPDGDSHSVWLGTVNACLSVDGTPEADPDVVSLGYFRAHMPMVEGEGRESLRQNTAGSEAGGTGSFAPNTGRAGGRYAFAANSGAASGEYAAAFGVNTAASGRGAAAFGYETAASGNGSFAAGDSCRAEGRNAHAEGQNTLALGNAQFAFGRFNVPDDAGCYVEMVGIGQSQARANGRTLDWNGNEWLAGTVEAAGLILRDESGTPYRIRIQSGALTAVRADA